MSGMNRDLVLWVQIVAVSLVGAVAVVCFLVSFNVGPDTSGVLRTIAYIAAGICAVIGLSFALTGRKQSS
ncbi:hypothetical protein [Brevibacterium litoralis]|uniref:hypothetical protein n=1 Tax=Brevibacterium litoralis TaxID=3138935 RepID=UPI0032EB14CC